MQDPQQDSPVDANTLRLLKGRDQDGLRHLLAEYGPKIKWYLRKEFPRALDDTGIADALNQAALRVWRSIDTFDPQKGTLRGWFYKIARNAALSIVQRENKARRVVAVTVEDWDQASFVAMHHLADQEPSAKQRKFLADLWRCILALPKLQKGIILADLQAGDMADAGDLAEAFHSSKNSIYASRSIARKALRDGLRQLGYFPVEPDSETAQ